MPSVESLEAASCTVPDAAGLISGHNSAAFDVDPPTRYLDRGGGSGGGGGGRAGYKDRGGRRDDACIVLGLGGIINTSKIRVSSGGDRGDNAVYGGALAGGRGSGSSVEGNVSGGGKRLRPKTAGAAVGRIHSSSLGTRGSANIPGILDQPAMIATFILIRSYENNLSVY